MIAPELDQKAFELLSKQTGPVKSGPISFNLVDAFTTMFGEWAVVRDGILVHLFPRAGIEDTWYEPKYLDKIRYVPGRREFKSPQIQFPKDMEAKIRVAADAVTFGDVELDFVQELGAWTIRFRDIANEKDWTKEGGFLEQFFLRLDKEMDQPIGP